MLEAKIERISIQPGHRIIAVSDLHGHLTLFRELLDKTGFCDADELFIIGDFLEKGPENLEILRYMMELDKRPNVHVMMGNLEYLDYKLLFDDEHAVFNLKWSVLEYEKVHGAGLYGDMLLELGIQADENTDFEAAVAAMREAFVPELEFLTTLPAIIETDNIIFVHGGIPSEDIGSFAGQDAWRFMKFDDFANQGLSFSKHVVVGHWPTKNYHKIPNGMPFISEKQRIVSIDGGCGTTSSKKGAQINALIITNEREFTHCVEYADGLPLCRALDSQAESADYTYFEYSDRHISILDELGDKTRVLHHATGRTLLIPKESIWFEGETPCATYTDYELDVASGYILGLCSATEDGWFVKKNGVCGWYRGRAVML